MRLKIETWLLLKSKKTQVSHRSDWMRLLFPSEKHFASWFSLFELPCITSKTFSLQNRADAEKSPCKSDIYFKIFSLLFSVKSPWWFWRFYCNQSQSVFHFSSQTSRNPNIRTMKADSMGKTMPDSSWRYNYSITFTPKWSFFFLRLRFKFWTPALSFEYNF